MEVGPRREKTEAMKPRGQGLGSAPTGFVTLGEAGARTLHWLFDSLLSN